MLPNRVYLSGGGMCAIAHVGALIELSKHIHLKSIKEWMGVSAGSFVSMCICIGFTLDELYDISIRFDFTNIKEYDSVPGWILHFGIDTGERLHKLIEACLHVKGLESHITFEELYKKFGKSLKIIATDINIAEAKVFSPKETPTYKVADAVRASMSYPYYFQPFICPETGHYLVDGGVISNYPLFVIPKNEHSQTLSILIRSMVQKCENLETEEMETIVSRPLSIVFSQRSQIESQFYDARCINIVLSNLNILDFSFDEKTKSYIIDQGKEAVQNYFKNPPKQQRRHSI